MYNFYFIDLLRSYYNELLISTAKCTYKTQYNTKYMYYASLL